MLGADFTREGEGGGRGFLELILEGGEWEEGKARSVAQRGALGKQNCAGSGKSRQAALLQGQLGPGARNFVCPSRLGRNMSRRAFQEDTLSLLHKTSEEYFHF